jgi:hypothetical protein
MMRKLIILASILIVISGHGAAAEIVGRAPVVDAGKVAVDVVNASRPTRCAEEDNVYVKLIGDGIAGFRIEATHPPYLGRVAEDATAPDFSHCDMSNDPVFPAEPRTATLFENEAVRVVGIAYPSFWRPATVPFRVAGREERGLHLIQLFERLDGGWVEVLVLYPPDGYWRVKPLPPAGWPDSAYGSSFMIGAIEDKGRPVVELAAVDFEPATRAFRLAFTGGGGATLVPTTIARDRVVLDIALDPAVAPGRPFAALRSMLVTPTMADVAKASWRPAEGASWRSAGILELTTEKATEVRFGRTEISRHNTSAPDLAFGAFSRQP